MEKKSYKEIYAEITKNGGVGVIPTDTLYGIVCSAFCKSSVEKIYSLKKRDKGKPVIVLISDISDLKEFHIKIYKNLPQKLKKFWPGPNSVLLLCDSKKFNYIHRETNEIAFRIPKNKELLNFLKKSGPIIAPSANTEGSKPAKNIKEAKKYFGDDVDFYIDGGTLNGRPSRLIKFVGNEIEYLR
jgi:L-threonylcarbamoyladenylate synthase